MSSQKRAMALKTCSDYTQVKKLIIPVLGQNVLVCPGPEQQFQQFQVAPLGGRVPGGPAGPGHPGVHLRPLFNQPLGKIDL